MANDICYCRAMNNPFEKLKTHFGSTSAIARHFGLTRQAVDVWGKRGIPPDYALTIERDTNGTITAMEILEDTERRRAA